MEVVSAADPCSEFYDYGSAELGMSPRYGYRTLWGEDMGVLYVRSSVRETGRLVTAPDAGPWTVPFGGERGFPFMGKRRPTLQVDAFPRVCFEGCNPAYGQRTSCHDGVTQSGDSAEIIPYNSGIATNRIYEQFFDLCPFVDPTARDGNPACHVIAWEDLHYDENPDDYFGVELVLFANGNMYYSIGERGEPTRKGENAIAGCDEWAGEDGDRIAINCEYERLSRTDATGVFVVSTSTCGATIARDDWYVVRNQETYIAVDAEHGVLTNDVGLLERQLTVVSVEGSRDLVGQEVEVEPAGVIARISADGAVDVRWRNGTFGRFAHVSNAAVRYEVSDGETQAEAEVGVSAYNPCVLHDLDATNPPLQPDHRFADSQRHGTPTTVIRSPLSDPPALLVRVSNVTEGSSFRYGTSQEHSFPLLGDNHHTIGVDFYGNLWFGAASPSAELSTACGRSSQQPSLLVYHQGHKSDVYEHWSSPCEIPHVYEPERSCHLVWKETSDKVRTLTALYENGDVYVTVDVMDGSNGIISLRAHDRAWSMWGCGWRRARGCEQAQSTSIAVHMTSDLVCLPLSIPPLEVRVNRTEVSSFPADAGVLSGVPLRFGQERESVRVVGVNGEHDAVGRWVVVDELGATVLVREDGSFDFNGAEGEHAAATGVELSSFTVEATDGFTVAAGSVTVRISDGFSPCMNYKEDGGGPYGYRVATSIENEVPSSISVERDDWSWFETYSLTTGHTWHPLTLRGGKFPFMGEEYLHLRVVLGGNIVFGEHSAYAEQWQRSDEPILPKNSCASQQTTYYESGIHVFSDDNELNRAVESTVQYAWAGSCPYPSPLGSPQFCYLFLWTQWVRSNTPVHSTAILYENGDIMLHTDTRSAHAAGLFAPDVPVSYRLSGKCCGSYCEHLGPNALYYTTAAACASLDPPLVDKYSIPVRAEETPTFHLYCTPEDVDVLRDECNIEISSAQGLLSTVWSGRSGVSVVVAAVEGNRLSGAPVQIEPQSVELPVGVGFARMRVWADGSVELQLPLSSGIVVTKTFEYEVAYVDDIEFSVSGDARFRLQAQLSVQPLRYMLEHPLCSYPFSESSGAHGYRAVSPLRLSPANSYHSSLPLPQWVNEIGLDEPFQFMGEQVRAMGVNRDGIMCKWTNEIDNGIDSFRMCSRVSLGYHPDGDCVGAVNREDHREDYNLMTKSRHSSDCPTIHPVNRRLGCTTFTWVYKDPYTDVNPSSTHETILFDNGDIYMWSNQRQSSALMGVSEQDLLVTSCSWDEDNPLPNGIFITSPFACGVYFAASLFVYAPHGPCEPLQR
eukprot:TRINITY_DN3370_c0_g1_i1.p1 TRINITY_DN3370_c0_g1~~TRINITY_DN3370_c0_g1_i1.p1  ORF type:complete len:1429 (-),score=147.69 TRINITY_DN3370_c0_g1_i1:744-4649(-)